MLYISLSTAIIWRVCLQRKHYWQQRGNHGNRRFGLKRGRCHFRSGAWSIYHFTEWEGREPKFQTFSTSSFLGLLALLYKATKLCDTSVVLRDRAND